MAEVGQRLKNWALEELRWASQVNEDVLVAWYNKGLQIFQKTMLEYVNGMQNVQNMFMDITKGESTYKLFPFGDADAQDFYSIIQLRVAYHTTDEYEAVAKYSTYDSTETYYKHTKWGYEEITPDHADLLMSNYYIKDGNDYLMVRAYTPYSSSTTYYTRVKYGTYEIVAANHADVVKQWYYILKEKGYPAYRICKPINLSDYNINPWVNRPEGWTEIKQRWWVAKQWPMVWGRISEINPRYTFISKDTIRIYPAPTEDIENWISLNYNYIDQPVTAKTNESSLNLPRYFFDAIEDYMTFRLYQAENPEMAQWYYQQFQSTLNDNIYGLNKDKRPVEEWFANTTYFSHY